MAGSRNVERFVLVFRTLRKTRFDKPGIFMGHELRVLFTEYQQHRTCVGLGKSRWVDGKPGPHEGTEIGGKYRSHIRCQIARNLAAGADRRDCPIDLCESRLRGCATPLPLPECCELRPQHNIHPSTGSRYQNDGSWWL